MDNNQYIEIPANDSLYETILITDEEAERRRLCLKYILSVQKVPAMKPKFTKRNLTFY
jgi:hypothetical protein